MPHRSCFFFFFFFFRRLPLLKEGNDKLLLFTCREGYDSVLTIVFLKKKFFFFLSFSFSSPCFLCSSSLKNTEQQQLEHKNSDQMRTCIFKTLPMGSSIRKRRFLVASDLGHIKKKKKKKKLNIIFEYEITW